MTDNEIIKALECCYVEDSCPNCNECPIKNACDYYGVIDEVFSLINRQKAEIERLQKDLTKCKLEKETLYHIGKEIKDVAIKDFAHFVIDRSKNGVICTSDIPDLVKEMTEAEK